MEFKIQKLSPLSTELGIYNVDKGEMNLVACCVFHDAVLKEKHLELIRYPAEGSHESETVQLDIYDEYLAKKILTFIEDKSVEIDFSEVKESD